VGSRPQAGGSAAQLQKADPDALAKIRAAMQQLVGRAPEMPPGIVLEVGKMWR
jgi:hypothetical protein